MTGIYLRQGGPIDRLRDKLKIGSPKLDVQAGINEHSPNDSIIRENVTVDVHVVQTVDGETENVYFSINGDDWLSQRFQNDMSINHAKEGVCNSTEIKRAPNPRTMRLTTTLGKAVMSWSGYTDNPVFVEAVEATEFERDVIKLQNYMWVDDRNEAMKMFVDEHNNQVGSDGESSNGISCVCII